jgi:Spy/CpxP family protein refolding chaperone
VFNFHFDHSNANDLTDEQIAQMYELMQAIRKQELEDNDPEFQTAIGKDPSKQE